MGAPADWPHGGRQVRPDVTEAGEGGRGPVRPDGISVRLLGRLHRPDGNPRRLAGGRARERAHGGAGNRMARRSGRPAVHRQAAPGQHGRHPVLRVHRSVGRRLRQRRGRADHRRRGPPLRFPARPEGRGPRRTRAPGLRDQGKPPRALLGRAGVPRDPRAAGMVRAGLRDPERVPREPGDRDEPQRVLRPVRDLGEVRAGRWRGPAGAPGRRPVEAGRADPRDQGGRGDGDGSPGGRGGARASGSAREVPGREG